MGDPFDQGGALAGEAGASLVVPALARGGDLVFQAALVEEQEVQLHRLLRGGLLAGHHHQFGDQRGEGAVFARQVLGGILRFVFALLALGAVLFALWWRSRDRGQGQAVSVEPAVG